MGNFYVNQRCPKCGGNMYLDRDYNGWYAQCLQCAYVHDLPVVYDSKKKAVSGNDGMSAVSRK